MDEDSSDPPVASTATSTAAALATGQGRIRKLDEAVVNRIAAGEVLLRPANAVKEMVENSIDAGATSITVTVKDGGMKLLQIQDNGHGIAREDLPLVCERFATSKLKAFDDLSSIATYGFRGEALASISHVAHVAITTKTATAEVAYRALYKDGKLAPAKPGASAEPRPTAGTTGTQITVEDLFYNVATRRKALQNPADEYARILEILQRYAIENVGVSITCKKHGSTVPDLSTLASATRLDTIRGVFGATVARELLSLDYNSASNQFQAHGYVSNANYSLKKFTFLLFINHRLVESGALKRAIEGVYSAYLPKNTHPFVYLSLEIAPANVDVNVHPTKREVLFLNEDAIVEEVCTAIQSRLLNANASRTFLTQTVLPGVAPVLEGRSTSRDGAAAAATPSDPRRLVRTDNRTRTLDAYLQQRAAPSGEDEGQEASEAAAKRVRAVPTPAPAGSDPAHDDRAGASPASTAAAELRREVADAHHHGLRALFRDHFFVGCVSDELALVQHQTRLCLVNHRHVAAAFFYQTLLESVGRCGRMALSQPASVATLVRLALDLPVCGWTPADGPKDDLARTVQELLVAKAAYLNDAVALGIGPDGRVHALPLVLSGFLPNLDHLPLLLVRLGTEVPWSGGDRACLDGLCKELARFYASPGASSDDPAAAAAADSALPGGRSRWAIEHVLFPALRQSFLPPKTVAEAGHVLQVADLPELYRIFERC